jgi:hypothetical protein
VTDIESTLKMQPSGRWAVCRPGHEPVEIPAGEVFLLEVPGHRQLQQTRMAFRRFEEGYGEYYSVDGYQLRDGLRAGFFDNRESGTQSAPTDLEAETNELRRRCAARSEGMARTR